MNQTLKDKLARAIVATLKQVRSKDPIDIAERMIDNIELVIDMETEESGIAGVPPEMQPEIALDWEQVQAAGKQQAKERPKLQIPPSRAAVVPVEPASRLIAMPGDPGFDDSKPAEVGKRRISALDIQRTPPKRPGSNVQERQYWDESTLMQTILENTPEQIEFKTTGPDGEERILPAIRNVHNQQGMGSVVLTYRHPRVDDRASGDVTVDLVAKWPFSLYEEHVDVDKAFQDPKGILVQLEGQYRVALGGAAPDPHYTPEPARLSTSFLRQAAMAGEVTIQGDMDGNGRLLNPGGAIGPKRWNQDTQQEEYVPWEGGASEQIRSSVLQRNDSIVPVHTQLKKR